MLRLTVHDFPAVHNKSVFEQAKNDVYMAKKDGQTKRDELASKADQYWRKHSSKGKAKGGKISLLGIPVAAGAAYLIMGITAAATVGATAGMATPFILLAIIFVVIFNLLSKKHVRKKSEKLHQAAEEPLALAEAKAEEIQAAAAKEAQEYIDAFWSEAQQQSLKFAESAAADAIAEWAMGHFSKIIASTPRGSHLEYIEACCRLTVFPDKINFGHLKSMKKPETVEEIIAARHGDDCPRVDTWDFEERRCQLLTTPLEQAALAHALATKLQLETMMAYPEDVCGSAVEIIITRHTDRESAMVNICYRAVNLDYQAVQKW